MSVINAKDHWMHTAQSRLGKEPILRFHNLDRLRAFLLVVPHVVDPPAYGIAPHQPSIVRLQQFECRNHVPHSRKLCRSSPVCPLSRARLEANRPTRDRLSFRVARKVRRRVAESAAQSGSGPSARPTLVRVLMALVSWGNTSLPLRSPQNRLLVSDGGHPFDVEGNCSLTSRCDARGLPKAPPRSRTFSSRATPSE